MKYHHHSTHKLLARSKELWVTDGVIVVGSDDVEAQPFGRFVGHLHSVLQDGDGEGGGGVAGQPQSEVRVCLLWVQILEVTKHIENNCMPAYTTHTHTYAHNFISTHTHTYFISTHTHNFISTHTRTQLHSHSGILHETDTRNGHSTSIMVPCHHALTHLFHFMAGYL